MENLDNLSIEELQKRLQTEKENNQKVELIKQIKQEKSKRTFMGKFSKTLGEAGKGFMNKVSKIGIEPEKKAPPKKQVKKKQLQKPRGLDDLSFLEEFG